MTQEEEASIIKELEELEADSVIKDLSNIPQTINMKNPILEKQRSK